MSYGASLVSTLASKISLLDISSSKNNSVIVFECVVLEWITDMGNLCHWSGINEAEHNKDSTSTSAAQTPAAAVERCWDV